MVNFFLSFTLTTLLPRYNFTETFLKSESLLLHNIKVIAGLACHPSEKEVNSYFCKKQICNISVTLAVCKTTWKLF